VRVSFYKLFFTLFLFTNIACKTYSQCGQAIDLGTWVEEGDVTNGDWQVGGGGANVSQEINGDPTFLVSPDSFINVIITGTIRVNTAADDDWVGFVFGYQGPDTADSTDYDFYLFDWKQADQNFSGFFGAEGFALSQMQGNITNLPQAFVGKQGPFANIIASDYGGTKGWNDLTDYDFALTYTNTRTVISIEGDTIFDVYGCFGPGRFGFYNYSQSDVIYSDFSYRVAASFEVVTPEVCVGDTAFLRALSDSCFTNAGVQVNNTIVGWDWDLGDGNTSTDTNVRHVYNTAGTFDVRLVVTDYLGCTDTAYNQVIIRESSTNLGADTAFCADTSVVFDAGTPGSSYAWNTGDTTQTIIATSTGTYQVTLTDIYGCESSDTVLVTSYSLPTKELPADTSICANDSLFLDAGNAGESFVWNTGDTTQTITVSAAGSYQVTITNANNCQISDTFQLSTLAIPSVNLGIDTSICTGDSLVIDAGNAGATYVWNDGSTNQTLTISSVSTYAVTVTNANTCAVSDTLSLGLYALPIVNLGNDTTICETDTITINAGNSTATFAWSTGETTQSISINAIASYQVTVTDTNSCSDSDTLNLNNYAQPLVDIGSDTSICSGDSITIDPNNTGQTYQWSTGQASESISVDTAGIYSVTVTDANTCQNADTLQLSIYNLPVFSLQADTSICFGDNLVLDAENAGASFVWQDGSTNQTLTVNSTGTYQVTVTDANTCSNADTMTLGIYSLPIVSLGADTSICASDTLLLDAQNPTASFVWNTTQSTQTIEVNTAGSYQVTVTDTNTCSAADTFTLSIFALPIVSLGADTSICDEDTLVLDAQNPTSSFVWQDASTSQTLVATNAATYGVTVTDTNTCSNSDELVLSIYSLPIVNLGPDTNICLGDNYTLNALNNGASYVWTGGSTNQTLIIDTAGTYGVTVTDANTCSETDAMVLVINQLPVLSISPADTSICLGESVVLQAFGDASIIWLNGVGFFPNGMTNSLSPTVTTTYTIEGTDSIGCVNTFTTDINVLPLPNISITLPNDTICKNDTVSGFATGGVSYAWTTNSAQLNTTGSANSFFPTQTTNFQVTGTDALGCENSFDTTIVVNALPQILVSPFGDSICVGQSTNMIASGAESYSWSPITALSFITDDTLIASPTDTITYTITGTDSNQCVNDTSIVVNVTPLPVISATVSDDSVCTITPTTLSVTGAVNYIWGPTSNMIGANTANPVVSPVSTTTYVVTATGPNGCQALDTVLVVVFDIPNYSAGSDTAICAGDTFQLNASGGATYIWNNGNLLSDPNIPNPNCFPTVGGFFRVTITDTNGCSFKDNMFVTVNPKPAARAGANVSVCKADTIQVGGNPTGPTGSTFSWTPVAQVLNPTASNPYVFGDTNTTFKVVVTNAFGCSDSSTVSIFVDSLPDASVLTAPSFICNEESGIVAVTGGFNSYSASPASAVVPLGNGRFEVSSTSSMSLTIRVTDIKGCTKNLIVPIEVKPLPEISAGDDVIVCQGDTATLIASGEVVSFFWGNQASIESSNEQITRVFPESSVTYTLTGIDTNGCKGYDDVRVRVHAKPVIDAGDGAQDCDLGLVTLGGYPSGPEFSSYTWSPVELLDNPNAANPVAFIEDSITYYLMVENEFGCVEYDSVVIVPDCYTIYAPNAFTPDGDGINETFEIKGFRYLNPSLEIYDRNGHILFQANDFSDGWDGNDQSAYPVPNGVYFWRVSFQDKRGRGFREEGKVSLIR